jgi:tripartite-type tricarboxylate transporter receptor subunit TctC
MPHALVVCIALLASLVLAPFPAAAQQQRVPDADTRPLRLLVGFPAGSNTDQAARVVSDALRERLGGRPVEVSNRPGTAGSVAAEAVARAAPDGTTLGFFSSSLVVARHVSRGLPFDPRTDFTPISLVATAPFVVLVSPDHPAQDLRGLAETLRTKPDTRCVTPGAGSFTHLTTVLLTRAMGPAAGCEAVHYSDPGQAMADLRTGRVQLYVNAVPSGLPAVREGRARALAVTSGRRLAAAPTVPTAAEAGLPAFEAEAWWALLGPRGLPESVTGPLERAAMEAARDPAVAERLRALGAEPVGSTAAELAATLQAEDAKWGEAVRAAKLAVE